MKKDLLLQPFMPDYDKNNESFHGRRLDAKSWSRFTKVTHGDTYPSPSTVGNYIHEDEKGQKLIPEIDDEAVKTGMEAMLERVETKKKYKDVFMRTTLIKMGQERFIRHVKVYGPDDTYIPDGDVRVDMVPGEASNRITRKNMSVTTYYVQYASDCLNKWSKE